MVGGVEEGLEKRSSEGRLRACLLFFAVERKV
jgi:hypothetical protein